MLIHVVDASDPGFERQLAVTNEVLDEIGARAVPRIHVFNKIDCVGDEEAQASMEAKLRAQYPDCMVLSARRDGDIQKLRATLLTFFHIRGESEVVNALRTQLGRTTHPPKSGS